MAYPQPPNNQYGAPQQPYGAPPPQQQYGQPPQQQQYQYGTQPQYGQQQPQYGAAPVQGQYGQPPQAPYGQPQQAYGQGPAPPQQQYPGQQPPQQYGAPPSGAGYQPAYNQQQGYGGPGHQPAYGAPPPQPGYGAPPQQPYGMPPQPQGQYGGGYAAAPPPMMNHIPRTYLGSPIHPSENPLLPAQEQVRDSQAIDGYDATNDVATIKKACKGFGTDEAKINGVLMNMPAVRLPVLKYAYKAREGKDLERLLEKELKGDHERLVLQVVGGPLGGDLESIKEACDGLGTHESVLTEILIGRPPVAYDLLKAAYQRKYNKSLEKVVLDELSFKTKSAMQVALLGEWRDLPNGGRTPEYENGSSAGGMGGAGGFAAGGMLAAHQVNQQMLHEDMTALSSSIKPMAADIDLQRVSSILFARSPMHLHALQQEWLRAKRIPMTRQIKQLVDGHLRDMYLFALNGSKKDTTGAYRDAKYIHKAMAGFGTKDRLLILRVVRAKWNPAHLAQVKQAYQAKRGKPLYQAVMSETSGDYRDGLMLILNGH